MDVGALKQKLNLTLGLRFGVEFAKMINLRKYSIYHTAFLVT